jgi:dTDP-4-dehydrorhamnose reductase
MVTGANGQLGYELVRELSLLGNVLPVDIEELDMTQPDKIVKFMRDYKPNIVVNSAGYTAVDTAEDKSDFAMQVNGIAPGIIATELKKSGGLMVHFSTDFAYDGNKTTPYNENDLVNPISIYAKSKVAGDNAILESGVKHLIFRTSWIYGARGRNFLLTMLNMCKERTELSVVNDQFSAPTWSRALASGVGLVLGQKQAYEPSASGIYHITGGGQASWYEFAVQIAKYYEFKTDHRVAIFPVSTGEYPMKATRPKYSVLDNSKLNNTFGVIMPEWKLSFNHVMQDMGYNNPAKGIFPKLK